MYWRYVTILAKGTCREENHLLNTPDNVKSIHFFTEHISFPVAIYPVNDWEKEQVSYLCTNFKSGVFTTLSLCRWCQTHNIAYQIAYPVRKTSIIRNPRKYLYYLKIKRNLAQL